MKLSEEEKKAIVDVWYTLMKKKKIRVRTVRDEISKEMLSETQLRDPKINEKVKKYGKYSIESTIQDSSVVALNHLTKLGYVKKINEKVYRIHLNYTAHPYKPHVYPDGNLGIMINSNTVFKHFDFFENEYKLFFKTANEFKNGMKSGNHRHMTDFNFGINFSYETVAYEMNDDFFDAMLLNISDTGRMTGRFSEPFIKKSYKRKETIEKKDWKLLSEFTEEQFLKGINGIRKKIKKLLWKKEFMGIVEGFDKRLYTMQKPPRKRKMGKQKAERLSLSPPDFFGRGLYSYENTMARIFEDTVSEYLRSNDHYHTTTRYHPPYLGKEIDVFGERGSKNNREILVCEAKFRLGKSPITKDELSYFNQKATEIKKLNQKDDALFNFWFVTNTRDIEKEAKKFLHSTKIRFMVTKLPANWERKADWKITKISEVYKKQTRKSIR